MKKIADYFGIIFIFVLMIAGCGGGDSRALPAAFDLRDVEGRSYVTPVKTQGAQLPDGNFDLGTSVGLCWAFSSMASFESSLLMHGIVTDANAPSANLSAWHLGNWNGRNNPVYVFNNNLMPGTNPPLTFGYTQNEPVIKGWGGDSRSAIDFFSSGKGPVLEQDAPFPLDMVSHHLLLVPPPEALPVLYRLKEALIFSRDDYSGDEEFRNVIKHALTIYGVIQSYVYFDAAGYPGQIGPSFFDRDTGTYYCDDPAKVGQFGHGVAIIGWDDNKDVPKAPGKGAWLIKNSLGTRFGEDGYYWVSYNDAVFLKEYSFAVAFIAGTKQGYGNPSDYQTHDGALSQITFTIGDNAYDYLSDDFADAGADQWASARFVATSDNLLKAVGFITGNRNEAVTVQVYGGWDISNNRPEGLLSSQTAYLADKGYRTVTLDTPVAVTNGQEFVIALGFAGNPGQRKASLVYVVDPKTPVLTEKTYRNYHGVSGWGDWVDYATLNGGSIFYVQAIMEK